METLEVVGNRRELLPRQPIPDRSWSRPRLVGEVRLPIAGPYRPRARLYAGPNGELRWVVRLWEVDRAVARSVDTETLRAFARVNGLRELAGALDALIERATRRRRR